MIIPPTIGWQTPCGKSRSNHLVATFITDQWPTWLTRRCKAHPDDPTQRCASIVHGAYGSGNCSFTVKIERSGSATELVLLEQVAEAMAMKRR
jgi:hypothetical protein